MHTEEIAMIARPTPATHMSAVSLFLSLSEELANASRTYTPPNTEKNEPPRYPQVSLDRLDVALILCRIIDDHLFTADKRNEEPYAFVASCIRDVCNTLGYHPIRVSELMSLLQAEVSVLIRVRFALCTRSDLKRASRFCFALRSYFRRIENVRGHTRLKTPIRAVMERAL